MKLNKAAKRAVEIAIERNEDAAMVYIDQLLRDLTAKRAIEIAISTNFGRI